MVEIGSSSGLLGVNSDGGQLKRQYLDATTTTTTVASSASSVITFITTTTTSVAGNTKVDNIEINI